MVIKHTSLFMHQLFCQVVLVHNLHLPDIVKVPGNISLSGQAK